MQPKGRDTLWTMSVLIDDKIISGDGVDQRIRTPTLKQEDLVRVTALTMCIFTNENGIKCEVTSHWNNLLKET